MTKQIVLVVAPPMVPLTPVVAQPDLSFIEGSTDRGRLPQSFDLGDPGLENQVAYFLSPDLSELQDGDIVLGIDVALATEDDNSMMAAEVSRPASLAGRETAARNEVRPSSAPRRRLGWRKRPATGYATNLRRIFSTTLPGSRGPQRVCSGSYQRAANLTASR